VNQAAPGSHKNYRAYTEVFFVPLACCCIPQACAVGFVSVGGAANASLVCEACPTGTTNPAAGSSQCGLCSAGYGGVDCSDTCGGQSATVSLQYAWACWWCKSLIMPSQPRFGSDLAMIKRYLTARAIFESHSELSTLSHMYRQCCGCLCGQQLVLWQHCDDCRSSTPCSTKDAGATV
jgi:hypothetical protein